MKENQKVKAILVYLKSDVGSIERPDGYRQYESPHICTQLLLSFE
jgi:hypothetical protein